MGDCGEEELLLIEQGLVFMIYQQMVHKQTGRIILNIIITGSIPGIIIQDQAVWQER